MSGFSRWRPHRIRDVLLAVLALHAVIAVGAFGAGAWATAAVMTPEQPGVLWPARVTVGLVGCAAVQLAFWGVWLAVSGHPGSTLIVLLALSPFRGFGRSAGEPTAVPDGR